MKMIGKILCTALVALTLAGCGSIRESYQLLSFQPDPRSGIGNQAFEVFLLSGGGRQPPVALSRFQAVKPSLSAVSPEIQRELRACEVAGQHRVSSPAGRERLAGASTIVSAIVSYAASAAFDAIKESIAAKAEKIARASQKSGSVRLVQSRNTGVNWARVKCVVVTRIDRDTKAPGLITILEKHDHGNASVLVPKVYWLDNSIAWTAKETANVPATVQVDIALAVHAVTTDSKTGFRSVREVGAVAVSSGSLKFGQEKVNGCTFTAGAPQLCASATPLIPMPPVTASAVMVSVNVQETGTSANAKDIAEATNNALDAVAKPALDEFAKQLTSRIGT